MKPFIKWVGGKSRLLKEIRRRFPYTPNDEFDYVEPFLGGGSVLFWVLRTFPLVKTVVVNDMNPDLTAMYGAVRDDVDGLVETLAEYKGEYHSLVTNDQAEQRRFYNEKRALFNKRTSTQTVQAALFIFLNKTCFNGIYRVSKSGNFTNSFGKHRYPSIYDEENLRQVSDGLQRVTILTGDFAQTLDYVTDTTMVYLDPPYKVVASSGDENFYTIDRFVDSEQVRLREFCDKLNDRGCHLLLSNSDPGSYFDNRLTR